MLISQDSKLKAHVLLSQDSKLTMRMKRLPSSAWITLGLVMDVALETHTVIMLSALLSHRMLHQ